MRRRASFRWLLLLPAFVAAGCTDDEPDPVRAGGPRATLEDASARTVEEGPAAIAARVRAGDVRYRLRGTWEPTAKGYRLCARIEAAPDRYLDRRVLWLEGRDYAFGTLTALGRRCRRAKGDWFDDHPPTLGLF